MALRLLWRLPSSHSIHRSAALRTQTRWISAEDVSRKRSRQSRTREGILLPSGWVEILSPAKGVYYVHYDTGVTTFTLPTGPPTKEQKAEAFQMKHGEQIAQLKPGARVELRHLRTSPEFNGKRAICERWDPSGKIVVRLETGQLKAVKPECVYSLDAFVDVRDELKEEAKQAKRAPAAEPMKQGGNKGWIFIMFVGCGILGVFLTSGRTGSAPGDEEGEDLLRLSPEELLARKRQAQAAKSTS